MNVITLHSWFRCHRYFVGTLVPILSIEFLCFSIAIRSDHQHFVYVLVCESVRVCLFVSIFNSFLISTFAAPINYTESIDFTCAERSFHFKHLNQLDFCKNQKTTKENNVIEIKVTTVFVVVVFILF